MKKFFVSMMAAALLFMSGASVNASAFSIMQSAPVDQFISYFCRIFTLESISKELDPATDGAKIDALSAIEESIGADLMTFMAGSEGYYLRESDREQLERFMDVIISLVGDDYSRDIIAVKEKLYKLATLKDVFDAFIDGADGANQYSYGNVSFNYPSHFELKDSDTEFGVHLYLQNKNSLPASLYMEIERINVNEFSKLTDAEIGDFLKDECQAYYDKYIDNNYKVTYKTNIDYHSNTNMAVMALQGVQYGHDFTGEFISILYDTYQITAFITGGNDEEEEEARKIFLTIFQ
ncbi:MAG: hypothetical protein J5769_02745 [Bacteroidales bacterium]|nr:hypothetical protein [Bacteroidales bacterium]